MSAEASGCLRQVSVSDVLSYAQAPLATKTTACGATMTTSATAAVRDHDHAVLSYSEVWLGELSFDWTDGSADALRTLLWSPGLPALRHLTLVSDLREELIDVLAESPVVARLSTLDLSDGVLGDQAASRLRERFASFAHLERLYLMGNAISREAAAGFPPSVIIGWQRSTHPEWLRFDPPLVSLFDAF